MNRTPNSLKSIEADVLNTVVGGSPNKLGTATVVVVDSNGKDHWA